MCLDIDAFIDVKVDVEMLVDECVRFSNDDVFVVEKDVTNEVLDEVCTCVEKRTSLVADCVEEDR